MLPIQKKLIKYNHYKNNNPRYIVIHTTGNRKPTAGALNHYNYFSGGNRGSSAHYFIDTDNIIQIIEDHHGSWAVGDGKNKYGIHNRNSISLEMCVNDMKNIDTVIDHTIDLTVHLMKRHNIPLNRVVRHYDASRKLCPDIFAKNNWAGWIEFKTLVSAKLKGGYDKMKKEDIVKIVNDILRPGELPAGQTHWSDESRKNLKDNGVNIEDRRPNDYIRRGEVIAIADRVLKAALENKDGKCGCCGESKDE